MVSLANDTCADALSDDRVTDSADLNETDAKKINGEVSSVVDAYVNKITSPVSSYEEHHYKSVSLHDVSNDQTEEVNNSEVTSKNTHLDQVIQSASVDKELIIKPHLKSILIHGISDAKARQAVTRNNGEVNSSREKYSNKGVSLASGEKESTPKINRKSVILRCVSDDKVAHSVSLVTDKDEDSQSDITSTSNEEHTFETTRERNSLHSMFNNQVLNAVRLVPVDNLVLQETCNGIITDHMSSTILNSNDMQSDVGIKSDESNCITGTSKVAKSINNVVFLSNMNSASLKSESLKGNKMFFINGNALDGTSVECKPDDKYNVICLPQVENINDLIKQMETERPVKSVKAVTTTSFVQLSQANLKNMNRNITLNVTSNSKTTGIEPGKQFEFLCSKLIENSANGTTNTKQLLTEKVTTTSALDCVPRTSHTSGTANVANNETTSAPGRGILTSVANKEMTNLSILGKDQDTIEESSAVFQARNDFIKCRRLLIEAAIHPKMPVKQPLPGYTGPTYSCEECDDTFVSVESLAKHKDRRSVLFTYACPVCKTALEFYNRCMFLLHVRGHNTSVKACFLNISMIPANKLNFRLLDDTENTSAKFEEQSFLSSRGSISSHVNPPGRKILIRSIDKSANPSNVRILKSIKKKKKKVGMTASSLATAVTLNTTTADKTEVVKVGQSSVPRPNIRVEVIDNRKRTSDSVFEDKSKSVVEKSKRKLELESSTSNNGVTKMKKKKGADQPHRSNSDSCLEKDNSAASKVTVDEKSNTRTTKVTSKSQTPAIEEIILTSSDEDDVTTETDTKTKVVSCRECHEDVTNLTKHYRGENRPRKEYPCEQCKYFNSSPCALSAHIRMHTKAQPYVCPDCGYFFSTLETFLIHVKQVCFYDFKAIRFKCPECSLLKPSVTQFSEHLRRDHVRDVFKCDACMTSSYSYKVVEQHIKKMHSDQSICILEGYCCILCPNLLISKTLLQQHINKHVYSLQYLRYVYICKMCKKYASGRMSKFAQHYHSCPQLLTESEKTKTRKPLVVRKPVEVEVTVEKDPLSIEEWEADKLKAEYVSSTRFCVMCQKENFNDSSLFCSDCVRYVDAEDTNACNESAISQEVGRSKRKFKCKLCKQFMNRDWPTITKHFEQYHHSDFDVSSRMRSAVENNSLNIGINRKRKSSVKVTEAAATKSPKMEFKYKCAKCGLSTNDRSQFHDHIVSHKLQSNTDFQCLECGWCFIVKPSLEKHLIVVHKIRERDLKEYFRENGIAVGDEKEDEKSLVENQCEVCYMDCGSKQNYDKHIRTHGMAFVAMQSKAKS